jgi:very-short-patch-repair endonuclease
VSILPDIRPLLEENANRIAMGERAFFIEQVEEQLIAFEEKGTPITSPVEQMFFIEWQYYTDRGLVFSPTARLHLLPQHPVGKYRLDFALDFFTGIVDCPRDSVYFGREEEIFKNVLLPLLGIEIDGHEWHEKTKDQVRLDKERERFLVADGWKILRFSGSEVFKDANNCVREAADCALKLSCEYHKAVREYLQKGQSGS